MSDIEAVFNDVSYLINEILVEHKTALADHIQECIEDIQTELIDKLREYMESLVWSSPFPVK